MMIEIMIIKLELLIDCKVDEAYTITRAHGSWAR